MAIERQVWLEQSISAPAEAVWARVSDHERTPSWIPMVAEVRIVEEGAPDRGGLGAVREVKFKPRGWSRVRERVTVHSPPERFHYILFSGMPGQLAHEGRVIVTPDGAGASTLRWEVDFSFRSFHWFRPFLSSFLSQFEAVLREGMAQLKTHLEMAQ